MTESGVSINSQRGSRNAQSRRVERINRVAPPQQLSLLGCRRGGVRLVRDRRRGAAQRHDHGRSRARRADRRRAVRLAGLGRPAFDIAGVVSSDLGSSGRFAPARDARHDVAADAGVADQLPGLAHARCRLPRHRHARRGCAGQLHGDVPAVRRAARRVADGLQAAGRARRPAQGGAPHLGHDLSGADGHPGRVQHADRLHQRGAARPTTRSCSGSSSRTPTARTRSASPSRRSR